MPVYLLLLGCAVAAYLFSRTQEGQAALDAATDSLMGTITGYVNGVAATFQSVGIIGTDFVLRADAGNALNSMLLAAQADGVVLKVNSAFRSMEEQMELYRQFQAGTRTDLVARPGFSNHQSGIAADIEVHRSTQSAEYRWLAANAAEYGFVNNGAKFSKPELWHWEFRA